MATGFAFDQAAQARGGHPSRCLSPHALAAATGAMVVLIMSVMPDTAFAQAAGNNILDTVQNEIVTQAKAWETTVRGYAERLFWLLALIEVALAAIWLALSAGTLEQWTTELVRRLLFIGFFLFVLTEGPDLAQAIVTSLAQVGGASGSISAADVFDACMNVASNLTAKMAFGWSDAWGISLMFGLSALLVAIIFGLIAAIVLAVIAEVYIGLLAGLILLGFGGLSHSRDFVIRYMVYAFSVGMKLLALMMVVSIGSNVLLNLADNAALADNAMGPISIAALSIVIFMVALYVPSIIQGVVQGVSPGSGFEVIRAGARAAVGAASTALAAAGSSLASAAFDKATRAPGAYGASTLGLANAKLKGRRR